MLKILAIIFGAISCQLNHISIFLLEIDLTVEQIAYDVTYEGLHITQYKGIEVLEYSFTALETWGIAVSFELVAFGLYLILKGLKEKNKIHSNRSEGIILDELN